MEQAKTKITVMYTPENHINPDERQARLNNITKSIQDLPALSTVATNLMHELSNPDTSVDKLTEIIGADPVLTAKVLRHANSAFYAIKNRIQTVRHAISMLGLDSIKEIALNLYFYSFQKSFSKSKAQLEERYLAHSLTSATLCKKLCRHYGYQAVGAGEAYLAGLLHNIGVFLLLRYKREDFSRALEARIAEGIPLFVAEERIMGCNHADLGGWLAKSWNLPSHLHEVISCHHRIPEDAVNRELLALIQLSDLVCNEMGITMDEGKPPSCIDPETIKVLKDHYPDTPDDQLLEEVVHKFGGICLGTGEYMKALEGAPTGVETASEGPEEALTVKLEPAKEKQKPEPVVKPQPSLIPGFVLCGLGHILSGRKGIGYAFLLVFTFFIAIGIFSLAFGGPSSVTSTGFLIGLLMWVISVIHLMLTSE